MSDLGPIACPQYKSTISGARYASVVYFCICSSLSDTDAYKYTHAHTCINGSHDPSVSSNTRMYKVVVSSKRSSPLCLIHSLKKCFVCATNALSAKQYLLHFFIFVCDKCTLSLPKPQTRMVAIQPHNLHSTLTKLLHTVSTDTIITTHSLGCGFD